MAMKLTNGEAFKKFCELLDKNPTAGAAMRRWTRGGCKLSATFDLASAAFGGVGNPERQRFMAANWQQRGAEVRKGMVKAIAGLEQMQRALGEAMPAPYLTALTELKAGHSQTRWLYDSNRFGRNLDYSPLAVLREMAGRRRQKITPGGLLLLETEPPPMSEFMAVVRLVMTALGRTVNSATTDAVRKGLVHFEQNPKNARFMDLLRNAPTEELAPAGHLRTATD